MAEIVIASPMLPVNLALTGGIEAHRTFLEEAGYTGMELHVMRFSRLAHELAARAAEPVIDNAAHFIRSGHQSFISLEQGMVPRANAGEVIRSMASIALFPPASASLKKLDTLQHGINRDTNLDVVVYPEIDQPEGFHGLPFTWKLFQPNVRVLRKWGIRTTDELIARAKYEGLTGIAWDGYHYLRTEESGLAMPKWDDALPQLLENKALLPVRETHVSIGRSDRTENDALMDATRQELGIFLDEPNGIGNTVTGRMLRMIHNASGGDMRYVVESRITKNALPTGMAISAAYAKLARNLAAFLDS